VLLLNQIKENNAANAMPILENYLSCTKITQDIAQGKSKMMFNA
jgi:hypothetical protein